MKSSKAYQIEGVGCIMQVTTQQGTNVAEALSFVPGVKIKENFNVGEGVAEKIIISRELIKF